MTNGDAFPLYSVAHLETPASRAATTFGALIDGIAAADERILFHHVALIPLRFENARDLPANDFARWVRTALQDPETAEQLAFAGAPSLTPLEEVRRALLDALRRTPEPHRRREAPEEAAFHFIRASTVTAPLGVSLETPDDIVARWPTIDRASLFYHLIEAPLLGPPSADLAAWLRARGAGGLARSAAELAAAGRPLAILQRDLGARWKRRLIPNRFVRRLEASETERREEARRAMARLAGRLRGTSSENHPRDEDSLLLDRDAEELE